LCFQVALLGKGLGQWILRLKRKTFFHLYSQWGRPDLFEMKGFKVELRVEGAFPTVGGKLRYFAYMLLYESILVNVDCVINGKCISGCILLVDF
jgi:hypothetical protein